MVVFLNEFLGYRELAYFILRSYRKEEARRTGLWQAVLIGGTRSARRYVEILTRNFFEFYR